MGMDNKVWGKVNIKFKSYCDDRTACIKKYNNLCWKKVRLWKSIYEINFRERIRNIKKREHTIHETIYRREWGKKGQNIGGLNLPH